MNKKGVDAVVATVLIIMITVAAVAIIWATVIPMIKNAANSATAEKVSLSIETARGYTTWDAAKNVLRVQVKRGSDNTNLTGIEFIFTNKGSSTNSTGDVLQNGLTQTYSFTLTAKPEKISIAPVTLKGVGEIVSSTEEIRDYSGVSTFVPTNFNVHSCKTFDSEYCDEEHSYMSTCSSPSFCTISDQLNCGSGASRCTDGKIGSVCTADGDCLNNRCSGDDNKDNSDYYFCIAGNLGDRCDSNTDCAEGNICGGESVCISTPTCSFTYSPWSTCAVLGGTQTRTVLTSHPSGCTGGIPITTNTSCVPTCTSFTYNSWSACNISGQQTTTVNTSTPSGCVGGSPVATQSCCYSGVINGKTNICNCSNLQAISSNLGGSYTLGQNIDCSGVTFTPISTFTGTLDGQNKIVSNLKIIQSSDYAGLFGKTSGATIKNIGLTNVNISGANSVGAIIGNASSTIVSNLYTTGTVLGSGNYVGGLMGSTYSTTVTNSYSTGNIRGFVYVGGFIGEAFNSYSITNSFTTGNVTQSYEGDRTSLGSSIGVVPSNSVSNFFWYNLSQGLNCKGRDNNNPLNLSLGCTAKTDVTWFYTVTNAPMNSWDFTNTWKANSGSYPTFK